MLFNSLIFLLFAAIFFLIWPFAKHNNMGRWGFIVLMSFIFYGWWDWRFLFLIVSNGLINFYTSLGMVKFNTHRKLLLWLGISGNLLSLFIFKYSVFLAELLGELLLVFHIRIDLLSVIPEFTLILPVGISFYTFQAMSYTIDVYRGKVNPTRNLMHFFSYLSMFPQLVAGPIVRARDLLQQLIRVPKADPAMIWHGIQLFIFGMFQKTVLADNIALMVDTAFQDKSPYEGSLFWWVVIVGFAFQIYCDFSGYSLMARGIAKLMGYHFKMNFNHPYLSVSLREFWMRWHISLSTWFRDYVYIPLGGSRRGFYRGIFYMAITMVVSGLWHGAATTFVLWGFVHALFLAFERITRWENWIIKIPGGGFVVYLIIMLQVLLAWVFFRSENFEQVKSIFTKLFATEADLKFTDQFTNPMIFIGLAILIEFIVFIRIKWRAIRPFTIRNHLDVVEVILAMLACIFFRGPQAEFIYFQF